MLQWRLLLGTYLLLNQMVLFVALLSLIVQGYMRYRSVTIIII